MKRTISNSMINIWSRARILTFLLSAALVVSACASVNIDSARTLGKAGRSVAVQAQQNIMVSDKEYLRARDSEAFLHGYSGATQSALYVKLLNSYDEIRQELAKRSVVFEKLADLYDTFGELAGLDAGGQTEKAIGDLGGAITEYAKQLKQPAPLSGNVVTLISKTGGMVVTGIQKAEIREASIQIREKIEAFQQLLENKLVREQMTGFRETLASSRKAAFIMLWDAGVYDLK